MFNFKEDCTIGPDEVNNNTAETIRSGWEEDREFGHRVIRAYYHYNEGEIVDVAICSPGYPTARFSSLELPSAVEGSDSFLDQVDSEFAVVMSISYYDAHKSEFFKIKR